MTTAPYISQLGMGEQCMNAPGVMKDAYLYSFVLDADREKMQDLVDRQLNAVAQDEFSYVVLGKHVIAAFMNAGKMTSGSESIGYLPDHEWTLFCLVAVFKKGHLLPERLVLYPLLVIVDTSIAMATGREIWGWKKEVGTVAVPRSGDPSSFVCQATLFESFNPQTEGKLAPLMTIEKQGVWNEPPSLWSTKEEALSGLGEQLIKTLLPTVLWGKKFLQIELASLISGLSVQVVNLKQFRDAEDQTGACYQALVESPLTIDSVDGGGVLWEDFQVTIADVASHALVKSLGMATSSKTSLALWLKCQFSAPLGRVVCSR